MKKHLFSILFAAFALTFMFGAGVLLSSCGHNHAYGDWQVVTEASCTEKGLEKRICKCGKEEIREIAALGHNYGEWQTETAATCTENGVEKEVCLRCGDVQTRAILAGHKSVVIEGSPATCLEIGWTDGLECSVCGEVLQAQQPIAALGHNFTDWAPTGDFVVDENNGTHERHCLRAGCGVSETGDCSYDTVTIDATCEDGGYNIHTCETCHNSYKHDFTEPTGHKWASGYSHVYANGKHMHEQVCLNNSEHINRVECSFGEGVETAATCFSKGYTTYTCSDCGYFYEANEKAQLTHQYDKWEAVESSETEGVLYHEHKCSLCQTTERKRCNVDFRTYDATCTSLAHKITLCNVCGRNDIEEYGSKREHTWTAWQHIAGTTEEDSKHERHCQWIGCQMREEKECHFVDIGTTPTCVDKGTIKNYCEDCQFTYEKDGGAMLGHAYPETWTYAGVNAQGQHQHKKVCGNDNSHVEYEICHFSMVETPATCLENGEYKYTCDECGNFYTEEIKALGHLFIEPGHEEDYNEFKITDDTHTRTCLRENCREQVTENHIFTKSNLCDGCGYDGLTYQKEDEHYVVVDASRMAKTLQNLIVPAYHKGLPVTKIGPGYIGIKESAFNRNRTLKTVILPKTLQEIGDYAFGRCENLETVEIADEQDLSVPSSLIKIDNYAFFACGKLRSAANLPDSLQFIGAHAFENCTSLMDIKISDNVEEIGSSAFSNTGYVNNSEHWSGDILYIGKHLIKAKSTHVGAAKVNDGILTIAESAFKDCVGMDEIYLPGTIIEIDSDAFLNCEGLQEVVFGGTFSQWMNINFKNDHSSPMNYATKLNIQGAEGQVEIPEGTTKIPVGTFKGSNITSIVIPATVTYIGDEAFENCEALATITFEDSTKIEYIGERAFFGTAFYKNPDSWTDGALYIDTCLIATDETIAATYRTKTGTTVIASRAFESNHTLVNITFNEELRYIGDNVFADCKNLTGAKFENPNNWFANGHNHGRGVSPDIIDGTNLGGAASYLTFYYTGIWRKTR